MCNFELSYCVNFYSSPKAFSGLCACCPVCLTITELNRERPSAIESCAWYLHTTTFIQLIMHVHTHSLTSLKDQLTTLYLCTVHLYYSISVYESTKYIFLFNIWEYYTSFIISFSSMSDSKLFKLISYLSSGFELSTLWILQSSTKRSCIFFGFLRASSLPAWVTCICFSLFLFPPSVLLPQPPFIPPSLFPGPAPH